MPSLRRKTSPHARLQIQKPAGCRRDSLRWHALQQRFGEPAVGEDERVDALGLEDVLQALPRAQRNELRLAHAAQQIVPKILRLQRRQQHEPLTDASAESSRSRIANGESASATSISHPQPPTLEVRPARRRLNTYNQRPFVPLLTEPAYQGAHLLGGGSRHGVGFYRWDALT